MNLLLYRPRLCHYRIFKPLKCEMIEGLKKNSGGTIYHQSAIAVQFIQNYKLALQCFKIAAKQGYTDAHINIGLLYAKGLGVRKDYHQALYWWKLAALKGHPSAPRYVRQLKKKIEAEG